MRLHSLQGHGTSPMSILGPCTYMVICSPLSHILLSKFPNLQTPMHNNSQIPLSIGLSPSQYYWHKWSFSSGSPNRRKKSCRDDDERNPTDLRRGTFPDLSMYPKSIVQVKWLRPVLVQDKKWSHNSAKLASVGTGVSWCHLGGTVNVNSWEEWHTKLASTARSAKIFNCGQLLSKHIL